MPVGPCSPGHTSSLHSTPGSRMAFAHIGVSLALAVLSGGPGDPMLHTTGPGCDHCAAMKVALLGEAPLAPRDIDRSADTDTDVLHYDLDIVISPGSQNITGTNII